MPGDVDIIEDFSRRLVSGEFKHGSKLRAEVLRADYGCAASTMREVLFRLSTLGLVDFQEQRGFRMPQVSAEKQHELTHLRIMLECEGTVMSIRQGGVAWEARLSAAHHHLSHIESNIASNRHEPGLIELWVRAEQEFHETLMSACGSDTLKAMHLRIYAQFRQQLVIAERNFGFVEDNIAEHQAIVDAALKGDEAGVCRTIHTHLKRNLIRPIAQPVVGVG